MSFPIPLLVPAATLALLLLTRKKAGGGGGVIVEPPLPVPPRPPAPPPPGPVPGGDIIDTTFVVDAPRGLRVRSAPSATAAIVATVPNGSQLGVVEFDVPAPPPPADADHSQDFGWAKVKTPQGAFGFVAARFLSASGVEGLAERLRQEKERQEGGKEPLEIPILGDGPALGWAPWRRGAR